MQPTPVFLPGKSHGRRSLVGYCPWGCKESDTTERLHYHYIYPNHFAIQLKLTQYCTSTIFQLKGGGWNGGADFPSSPVVKNPPCNAEDTGSIPSQGTKIPHAFEQLSPPVATTEARVLQSPCTTSTEPTRHNESLCAGNERSHMTQ